jgi:DNA-binding response OmpR family regulator
MSKCILWIEDEIYRIESLINVLREENIKVVAADTKKKWEEELRKKADYYDLVILDIGLTENPALEAYEEWSHIGEKLLVSIKKQWPKVPVVVLSGTLTSDDGKG